MKNKNEVIQKLSCVPNWSETHRLQLSAALRAELATVLRLFTDAELRALAGELPKWLRSFRGDSLERLPLGEHLHAIAHAAAKLDDTHLIALQLLLMDARDGKSIARRTLNGNVRRSVPEPTADGSVTNG
jgi:hypothetical protein